MRDDDEDWVLHACPACGDKHFRPLTPDEEKREERLHAVNRSILDGGTRGAGDGL